MIWRIVMALSSNPLLNKHGFLALPRKSSSAKTKRIDNSPIAFNVAKAEIVVSYYDFLLKEFAKGGATPLFEEAFKLFYLRNTKRKPKWNPSDYSLYFKLMLSFSPTGIFVNDVDNIASKLKSDLSGGGYQLSFASKLVNIIDNNCPLIDSNVIDYLRKNEGVRWTPYDDPKAKYAALCKWYNHFMKSDPRYKKWIAYFDKTFPTHTGISASRKIDFILFFCN